MAYFASVWAGTKHNNPSDLVGHFAGVICQLTRRNKAPLIREEGWLLPVAGMASTFIPLIFFAFKDEEEELVSLLPVRCLACWPAELPEPCLSCPSLLRASG
jgi:hypothetical protein